MLNVVRRLHVEGAITSALRVMLDQTAQTCNIQPVPLNRSLFFARKASLQFVGSELNGRGLSTRRDKGRLANKELID